MGLYKSHKQKSFDPSLDHCLKSVRAMLQKSKYCFLITNSDRPWPSARLVQPIPELDSFVIWLGTHPALRKVQEIEKNQNVAVAFGSNYENANLIIYGTAHIVRDVQIKRKHWIGSWLMFFTNGPTAEDFVSVRVDPKEIELMNFKRNIVPEPFGLKPVKLVNIEGNWQVNP